MDKAAFVGWGRLGMFGDWFDGCWAMWIAKGSLKMGKSVFQAAFIVLIPLGFSSNGKTGECQNLTD